ncbi:MAG: cobaltochelatase subunit CobN [Pseudomonadota bacterium]
MHLLAATPGQVSDGQEPVDLGQTPADIVFISAADTELAALSQARAERPDAPTLRLANLTHLHHPLSVDMHLDSCAMKSKLVIARLLGGSGYWRYGFEQYAARLAESRVQVAFLPGDDKPDDELKQFSSVNSDDFDNLWAYLVEGGPENASLFLDYAAAMLRSKDHPPAAKPLLKAGVYWPGSGQASLNDIQKTWTPDAPIVPIIFYRALVQGAGLNPINRLTKSLARRGLNPLPIFVASLKDPVSAATLESLFAKAPPSVILNCTSFATGTPEASGQNPLAVNKAPVFQVVLSASSEEVWKDGLTGLSARDIAMNVALPEVDGRILSRAISFKDEAFFDEETQCAIATYRAEGTRVEFVADLAQNWARLRKTEPADRQVALILANYPNKDGRLANGVGLDTPAATVKALQRLAQEGYHTETPENADALMAQILAGPTNWLTDRAEKEGGATLSLSTYEEHYKTLPYDLRQKIEDRWGKPEEDPFFVPKILNSEDPGFKLSILTFGNVTVGVQPARGYNIDPEDTYHSPDLAPPHNYLAFYFWLRHVQGAHALVHMGKHGNLEWLPGKALALSDSCAPEAILGPVPHIYPFIVNDPGEGTQAKRRAQAVILDHLTPPLTRAETYGPLRDLEALVDEYYEAAGVDPRRVKHLKKDILTLAATTGLDTDIGMAGDDVETDLAKLDAYLCELKEAQIRDGLHIFGTSPEGDQERDLTIALARLPRGDGQGANASLIRALARDCGVNIDPLDCDMAAPYDGPRHKFLKTAGVGLGPWRSNGDTVERLEELAKLALGWGDTPKNFTATTPVLEEIHARILPAVRACGPAELDALVTALNGHAIPPGPSGAPTRGRLDVLPTGRNFFSVDSRAVPTPTAWKLGWKSASLLVEKHLQDNGDWPRSMLLTAWGTSNMRTGGDDIAQCLALMGAKPTWDAAGRRVTGFEILPASVLGRPRVDVTLRVSGFFRDAFPGLIDLVDSAARAIQALDESAVENPAKAAPGPRVYGSKPGAYGAGLQAMIDERLWRSKDDLGEAYLEWSSYAYGKGQEGARDRQGFETRLRGAEAIVQNQDNREHDILDSDDYYQFEGGAAAAISSLKGEEVPIYHNDHSRPESPRIRTLDDEIARVVRARAANPKWIAGVMRHGYKGAFEMAATTDYLFAFAATTGAVRSHHFDLIHEAYLEDEEVRDFIAEHNAPALREMAERFQEAIDRGLWQPRSNSARALLSELLS